MIKQGVSAGRARAKVRRPAASVAASTALSGTRSSSFRSRVVAGDCLDILREMPEEQKFDLVIADPPYNIGKDFGNDSDKMPMQDYLDWTQQWLALCLELLEDDGIIYVYGFAEILARVAVQFPVEQQRWLVWHYTNKAVPSLKFWQRSHETILCLWKPGRPRPDLEIDQIRDPYTDGYRVNIGRPRKGTQGRFSRGSRETTYKDHGGALPRDVIKVPALAGGAGAAERWFMCHDCGDEVYPPAELKHHRNHRVTKHPTQKPMELARRLVLSRINGEGGRVLVPFAGSGSECVVAAQMGLEWLGIELNPVYAKFAKKRIKACTD